MFIVPCPCPRHRHWYQWSLLPWNHSPVVPVEMPFLSKCQSTMTYSPHAIGQQLFLEIHNFLSFHLLDCFGILLLLMLFLFLLLLLLLLLQLINNGWVVVPSRVPRPDLGLEDWISSAICQSCRFGDVEVEL